jgi:hypothetical protein
MHLAAYVESLFDASKLNVSTALINPNVPIESKSSLSIFVDSYFLTKVLHNEIIEVSEEFLQQRKPYSIKPVESINNLYETYGLDSLLKYLEEYPINQLRKDDLDSFDWSAYLLWQNNIYVSLDGEVYYWYINYRE